MSARLEGNLWEANFARIVLLDVSDDYELMREPLPAVCYPILGERWVPRSALPGDLAQLSLASGYLYDWHELIEGDACWYVGMVRQDLVEEMLSA